MNIYVKNDTNLFKDKINERKMQNLDIVNLIERNPLVNLSRDYQNKFINKIKQRFNNEQQQLFVASFYCYLNHDSEKDFVIDMDDIWKWIGFST